MIGMTKNEIKAIHGTPIKENKWRLVYDGYLEFHFKRSGLYLAVINTPNDHEEVTVLAFDESCNEPINFILATVL